MTKVVCQMASIEDRRAVLRQNLVDAGCDDHLIACCMDCFQMSNKTKAEYLLRQQRRKLLGKIHTGQKQLDCLDYLLYRMDRE